MDAILPGVLVREKLCYIVSTFGKTFGPLPTTHVQLLSSFYHFTCIFDIPLTCLTKQYLRMQSFPDCNASWHQSSHGPKQSSKVDLARLYVSTMEGLQKKGERMEIKLLYYSQNFFRNKLASPANIFKNILAATPLSDVIFSIGRENQNFCAVHYTVRGLFPLLSQLWTQV